MKFLRYLSFSLLAVVILVMIVATIVEKVVGSASTIYSSWWFSDFWTIVVVASLCYIFRAKMQRRPALLLFHISLVIILMGACITHFFGKQGVAHIRLDHPCVAMEMEDQPGGSPTQYERLPFTLHLSHFEVRNYPGTQTPMDYISSVSVFKDTQSMAEPAQADDESLSEMTISMNHIGEYEGYRFYQSAYDPDLCGTILAVSYDPWGIGVTYAGYFMLFLSMLLLLVLPSEGFRRTLKRLGIIALLLLPISGVSALEPQVLPDTVAQKFGELYAYYNGRICPVQTVARDFTTKLYGKPSYQGYSAEQVFTGWLFFPASWEKEPLKSRKGERSEAEQQAITEMLVHGEFLYIYPYRGGETAGNDVYSPASLRWFSQSSDLPLEMEEKTWFFIRKSFDYLGELAVTKQYERLSSTLDKIHKYQVEQAGSVLPSNTVVKAERLYNRMQFTRPLSMAMIALGLLLWGLYLFYWLRGRGEKGKERSRVNSEEKMPVPRILHRSANWVIASAAFYQFFLLLLRSFVSGHLPLSNGYETMQFMALTVLLLTLLLQRRFVLIVPFGYLVTGLTLLVSMMGEANPQITPLMPVLQSPLLSIHVCIIMLAYSLLAITFFNGISALLITLLPARYLKRSEGVSSVDAYSLKLQTVSQLLLYPALFCMAAGIFIGAIWANVSWGRYWGWDPKEVWALITMLVYCFALHRTSLPWFQRPRFFHLFMVLAFLCVLMTYFGVNFLLGGMHSYANA